MKRALLVLIGLALGLGLILWLQGREGSTPAAPPAGSGTDHVVVDGKQYTVVDVPTDASPGLTGHQGAAPPTPPRRHGIEIVLLDREDRPIAGQLVEVRPGKAGDNPTSRTDEEGVAYFPNETPKTCSRAYARADAPRGTSTELWWVTDVPIEGVRTEARCQKGVPFELQIVDGVTGAPVPAARWGTGYIEELGTRRLVGNTACAIPGDPLSGSGWPAWFGFYVEVPKGYVAWDPQVIRCRVPSGATRLHATYALRREVHVVVSLGDQLEHPIKGRVQFQLRCAGRPWKPVQVQVLGENSFRVRGLPFLPSEPFVLRAADTAGQEGTAAGRIPVKSGQTLRLAMTSFGDEHVDLIIMEDIEFDGPAGGGIGHNHGRVTRPEPPRGTLTVLCLLADGSPARSVQVYAKGPEWEGTKNGASVRGSYSLWAQADSSGRVAWADAPVGEWELTFTAWNPAKTVAVVREDATTDVTIREPTGGELRIQAVTPDNHPLPFCTIAVRHKTKRGLGLRPLPDHDGLVRVDAYTDHLGTRTLQRLAPRTYQVTVRFGSREETVSAELGDREVTPLVVVLDPPE